MRGRGWAVNVAYAMINGDGEFFSDQQSGKVGMAGRGGGSGGSGEGGWG